LSIDCRRSRDEEDFALTQNEKDKDSALENDLLPLNPKKHLNMRKLWFLFDKKSHLRMKRKKKNEE